MAQKKAESNKSNVVIMAVMLLVCLSIPIIFVFYDADKPSDDSSIIDEDGNVREDYDPGVAWLQSKPIMVPESGGFRSIRATMRMKDRASAKNVCSRHPHLADTILTILTEDTDLMEEALNGYGSAHQEIHKAVSERLGTDLFTATIIKDGDEDDPDKSVDKVRYECGSEGLRLIFDIPPRS